MEKIKLFENTLNDEITNYLVLQGLCFSGIPSEYVFRPICWKILLGYLSTKNNERNIILNKNRKHYDYLLNTTIKDQTFEVQDHPLNSHPSSYWSTYFKENEILLQINKDVKRLCPYIQFFQEHTNFPLASLSLTQRVNLYLFSNENITKQKSGVINLSSKYQDFPRVNNCIYSNGNHQSDSCNRLNENVDYNILLNGSPCYKKNLKIINQKIPYSEYHWEVCQRILFAYAKLNPGQGYIQGMNEILGPIYYVFANSNHSDDRKFAEHDSFFCFTRLMSELRDNFTPHLDIDKNHGIGSQLIKLNEIIQKIDPDLMEHFKAQELHLNYFAYRWLMLLFSQEFKLKDVIRLWDSIFSTNDKMTFCLFISTAMLIIQRRELLAGDFSRNLKLLQNYPTIDIHKIISKALEIEEFVSKPNEHPTTYPHL